MADKINYTQSILEEIYLFRHLHNGKCPAKIFISRPLFFKVQRYVSARACDCFGGKLFGIPFSVYEAKEEEYYLSEEIGVLRSYPSDEPKIHFRKDFING